MCGICGKLIFDPSATVERGLVPRMLDAISHRGPDGRGQHCSGQIALGHARLAIIDLNTGSQPIFNEDRTVSVVFNGEIYNFRELRAELVSRGHIFRTLADTETIVHAYEEYGVGCLSKLKGMFAFALWDETKKSLLLARDRVGIKPLYYAHTAQSLVFGSEIKALLADPIVTCEADPHSIDKFLTHLCLPGSETLWKGICKLEPGCFLTAKDGKVSIQQYWDLEFKQTHHWQSFDEASEALHHLIRTTVREHMVSDVPVGFLLSGGVDSTAILSCAASETSKKISTFTVGFSDGVFADERPFARMAAKCFGTEHHEITISPQQFWDFLPSLMWHMEEPVCDPPAVSLHYVSKLARDHVTVLLSGEGGDEAFGGYRTYRNFLLLEKLKAHAGPLARVLPASFLCAARLPRFGKMRDFVPYLQTPLQQYYFSRAASPFSYFNTNKRQIYTRNFYDCLDRSRSTAVIDRLYSRVKGASLLEQMQYIDTKTSLADDLLIKADRMTMANSLELRVPFLDHLVLEFAAGLPPNYKVQGLATKRILKNVFQGRIPKEILQRKKAGFPIPIGRWIRRELRDPVRQVLLSQKCLSRGIFRKEAIEKLLTLGDMGHLVDKEIFSLLTIELLLRRFVDRC